MAKIYDLSHYQVVDWKKFKADCVIAKCTEGTSYVDATYADKKKHCQAMGILFGAYHFARGLDAKKEAKWFLKNVGDIVEGELLALDYEIHLTDPVTWCDDFLKAIYDIVGFRPLIYLNSSTESSFNWSKVAKNNGLWLANYGNNDGRGHAFPELKNWKAIVLHQYTSAGIASGIAGRVDVNLGDIEVLKKYGKIVPKPIKKEQVAQVTAEEVKIPIQATTTPVGVTKVIAEALNMPVAEVKDIIYGEGVAYTASPDLSKVGQILSNAEPTLQERIQAFFEAIIKIIKK